MIGTYTASVYTPAGWRPVSFKVRLERVSPKVGRVVEVLEVNGEAPRHGMSRTGARRQAFNGLGVAQREIGARKFLSKVEIEEEATV